MAIQHLQQLDQRHRWLGLSVLVPGERVYAAAEDLASFALVEVELLAHTGILDNITLYWLTNTAVSSARLYWESKLPFFAPKGVALPVAVSAFPDEIYTAPQSWTERAYPKLVHYNRLQKGGHFAAWEQPQLFAAELRAGFKSLRLVLGT